jgi:hypothetical protein
LLAAKFVGDADAKGSQFSITVRFPQGYHQTVMLLNKNTLVRMRRSHGNWSSAMLLREKLNVYLVI